MKIFYQITLNSTDDTQKELEALYSSIEVTGELTIRVKARIVSFGETLMANLMDKSLKSRGLKSEFVDSKRLLNFQMKLMDSNQLEELGIENCNKLIKPLFDKVDIVVVQGFIGSTLDDKGDDSRKRRF